MTQAPIIVLGTARSGAGILARMLAASDEHFLITDQLRHLKPIYCPEDRSGISDEHLWWKYFAFDSWDEQLHAPAIALPRFEPDAMLALRDRYLDMAKGRRLVIKNPHNLARLSILRRMFPEASFVFALRAPWPTIQSATIEGSPVHLARTYFVNAFPSNLLLRAAASWAEAIDILGRQHDDRWVVVPYENLLAKPKATLFKLYHRLGIDDFRNAVRGASLAAPRERDYSFLKGELLANRHAIRILKLVLPRALALGYPGLPFSLKGSALGHLYACWSAKHFPPRPQTAPESIFGRMAPAHADVVDLDEAGGFFPLAG